MTSIWPSSSSEPYTTSSSSYSSSSTPPLERSSSRSESSGISPGTFASFSFSSSSIAPLRLSLNFLLPGRPSCSSACSSSEDLTGLSAWLASIGPRGEVSSEFPSTAPSFATGLERLWRLTTRISSSSSSSCIAAGVTAGSSMAPGVVFEPVRWKSLNSPEGSDPRILN